MTLSQVELSGYIMSKSAFGQQGCRASRAYLCVSYALLFVSSVLAVDQRKITLVPRFSAPLITMKFVTQLL